jgi:uncharacterized protein
MTTSFHRMPEHLFAALASGGGGQEAIRILVAGQRSKHLLLLQGVLNAAEEARHQQVTAARAGYRLLASVQRRDPGAAAAVINYPSVGAWAHRTMVALRRGAPTAGAEPGRLPAVAAAAAIRARIVSEIEVLAIRGMVVLPSLGAAAVGGQTATVCISPDGARICANGEIIVIPADYHRKGPGWLPLPALLDAPFELLVDGIDPFRMPAAPHLAEPADFSRWAPFFAGAWSLLEARHQPVAAEVAEMIKAIVPLAPPSRGQVSSSSPETFGAIALSEPVRPLMLAATLAHEVQHVKLSALLDIVELTCPDSGRRFYAPWREDPRPASGLLQGAYAYLGVTAFWRRQREAPSSDRGGHRAHVEFARWREATRLAVSTLLASDQLTEAGKTFAQGMATILDRWSPEHVPLSAHHRAARENARHRQRWVAVHGHGSVP